MNTQHTPERWFVSDAVLGVVVDEYDIRVAVSYGEDWAQRQDRAQLIAAAPDMLAALIGVIKVADRATMEFDAAREAVAKATGGVA